MSMRTADHYRAIVPPETAHTDSGTPTGGQAVKRILFVDDEKNVLDGIRRMLHADRHRWHIEFAVGAEEGLRACETCSFDVVISDMQMPGMDGATFLGRVRALYPSTARFILSGFSEVALTGRAVEVAYCILSKPCNRLELAAAITRVCALQDLFCTSEIRQIIGTIGALPSPSGTYLALAEAIEDPTSSLERVAAIVTKDVAMSAKILQLVNSGFFGLAHPVNDLLSAVGCLGMDTIKYLALATHTFSMFVPDSRIPPSFWEEVQRHAFRTAAIAGTLPLPRKERGITILSGLLHDIGDLVLASKMPDRLCAVLSLMNERGCKQFEAEEEILGTSHAEIGAYLLGLWGINGAVIEAIAHHHHPARISHRGLDTSAALYLADLLASEVIEHPNDARGEQLSDADRDNLNTLGLFQDYANFHERATEALATSKSGM
jgi:HD-like signal output (HDOD) protein/ActR/RegA family two-component response regulator